jgi:hypothetical protein
LAIDLAHQRNLGGFLRVIDLINAERVNPDPDIFSEPTFHIFDRLEGGQKMRSDA